MLKSRPTDRILLALGAVLAIASVTLGVLAPGEDKTAQGGGGGEAVKTDVVVIRDFEYMPPTIEVEAGTKITFKNDDTAGHTATADMGGAFDTGAIDKGESKTVTLEQAGEIPYHCGFHPYMKGTVVVR